MTSIQPFRIAIADDELADLRDRLHATRWPDAGPAGDAWDRGVPLGELQALAARWADDFDWRAQEKALDAVDQGLAEIDGQPIHFLHVRSGIDGALPLLLIHSWPGSPVEFLRLDPFQRKRVLRRVWVRLPLRSPIRFFVWYVGRGGFLDGRPGFVFCALMSWYEFIIGAKLRELDP